MQPLTLGASQSPAQNQVQPRKREKENQAITKASHLINICIKVLDHHLHFDMLTTSRTGAFVSSQIYNIYDSIAPHSLALK